MDSDTLDMERSPGRLDRRRFMVLGAGAVGATAVATAATIASTASPAGAATVWYGPWYYVWAGSCLHNCTDCYSYVLNYGCYYVNTICYQVLP